MKRYVPVALAIIVLWSGCGRKKRTSTVPPAPRSAAAMPHVGDEEVGIASWYGYPYHGRRAANGEVYDMEKLTAAHRTLPFGTMVEVANLTNDLAVDVRITDRGPFVDGRIIDLSRAAARQIRVIGPGVAKVRLRIVGLPSQIVDGYFAVQAGAFASRENADRQRKRMEERYGTARLVYRDGNPPVWRVMVGREKAEDAANALASRIKKETGPAFVVRVDASENN